MHYEWQILYNGKELPIEVAVNEKKIISILDDEGR